MPSEGDKYLIMSNQWHQKATKAKIIKKNK